MGQHVASIKAAENLSIGDVRCRYLTVVPLWNVCIEGFGLHDPGKGRHQGEIPWWDALHPGRVWATRLRQTKTAEEAIARLREFLAGDL